RDKTALGMGQIAMRVAVPEEALFGLGQGDKAGPEKVQISADWTQQVFILEAGVKLYIGSYRSIDHRTPLPPQPKAWVPYSLRVYAGDSLVTIHRIGPSAPHLCFRSAGESGDSRS